MRLSSHSSPLLREGIQTLHNDEKRPSSEIAKFVQSWLYFDFLREFLGDRFAVQDFIRRDTSGNRYIGTDHLECLLHSWTFDLAHRKDETNIEMTLDAIYKLSIDHRALCLRLSMCNTVADHPSLLLSIAILGETFMVALMDLCAKVGLETPVVQRWRLHKKEYPDIAQMMLELMRSRKWCPYDVRRLDVETDQVFMLYYYSMLAAPRAEKNHDGCSEERCLAMLTNPSTYKLSHRREDCSCPLLAANEAEVANILTRGSIPLISMNLDTSRRSIVSVHDIS